MQYHMDKVHVYLADFNQHQQRTSHWEWGRLIGMLWESLQAYLVMVPSLGTYKVR